MRFPCLFPAIIISVILVCCSILSTAQTLGFRCRNSSTRNSLIDYKLLNTTTLSAFTRLFQIKNLCSLLAANNLPIITTSSPTFPASLILKIPFLCLCLNDTDISNHRPNYTVVPDDGLYHIVAEVFSSLVTYQQTQSMNGIVNADRIPVRQELWIPLPCSCDDVDGQLALHYGYLVPGGKGESDRREEVVIPLPCSCDGVFRR